VVKRGFVVGVAGAAVVVAGLAGCSSNKSGTAASGKGDAKVTIDGKDQSISGNIGCVTQANTVNIALGDASGGLSAQLTTDDPPKVNAVALGNFNGTPLAVGPGAGDATATKDGRKYTIKGNAIAGIDMSNPMAGPAKKPFEIVVSCP
jgi:lipoprotein LpqH